MSVGQLRRVVSAYRRASGDTGDPDGHERCRRRRGIWTFDEPDGLVRVTALLEPDDAAVLRAALAAHVEMLWRDPEPDSTAPAGRTTTDRRCARDGRRGGPDPGRRRPARHPARRRPRVAAAHRPRAARRPRPGRRLHPGDAPRRPRSPHRPGRHRPQPPRRRRVRVGGHRPATVLRRPHPAAGPPRRPTPRHRAGQPHAQPRPAPRAALPRRGLHLSRLRVPPLARCPPHHPLGPRRPDRPREPDVAVPPSPPAPPRRRLHDSDQRRPPPLPPARRHPDRSTTAAGARPASRRHRPASSPPRRRPAASTATPPERAAVEPPIGRPSTPSTPCSTEDARGPGGSAKLPWTLVVAGRRLGQPVAGPGGAPMRDVEPLVRSPLTAICPAPGKEDGDDPS